MIDTNSKIKDFEDVLSFIEENDWRWVSRGSVRDTRNIVDNNHGRDKVAYLGEYGQLARNILNKWSEKNGQ